MRGKVRKYCFYEGDFSDPYIGYYHAKKNIEILLSMPRLPNKIFPWLDRQGVLVWQKRLEGLRKKVWGF